MHCKCVLECEYKIINLEQHVCNHNMSVCLLLKDWLLQFGRLLIDIDIGNQTSIQPQCTYIHKPATGRCSYRTSAVSTLCNGKTLHMSARVHCVVSSSCKNHCPTYTLVTRIRVTENERCTFTLPAKR